jgi:hypothetical protein
MASSESLSKISCCSVCFSFLENCSIMTSRNLYSDERKYPSCTNVKQLLQSVPVIQTADSHPPTLPSAHSSLLPLLLHLLVIYFYIILASFLLIHRQLSCSVQSNISSLSNHCCVSNIPFLSAVLPPPPPLATPICSILYVYSFISFLRTHKQLLHSLWNANWKDQVDMIWHEKWLFEASK